MKVWCNGMYHNIEVGQEVTIYRLGGFLHNHIFGEAGRLDRVTTQHLIFVSASGGVVKTKKDNLHCVVGRMGKEGWNVTLKSVKDFKDILLEKVRYWDDQTCTFKYK